MLHKGRQDLVRNRYRTQNAGKTNDSTVLACNIVTGQLTVTHNLLMKVTTLHYDRRHNSDRCDATASDLAYFKYVAFQLAM
jgi:hypothetical protein